MPNETSGSRRGIRVTDERNMRVKEGISDALLVQEAAAGSEEAIRELVLRYQEPLLRFVKTFLHDKNQAEDVVQESFVRALEKIDQLRNPDSLKSWLWSVTRSIAVDRRRRRERDLKGASRVIEFEDMDLQVSPAPPADIWMARQSLIDEMRGLIRSLPPESRELLRLRYHEQLSHREIGALVGVGAVTVKARLARVRQRLKSRLEPLAREWMQLRDELF